MDYITVLPPNGLYRELYDPSPEFLSSSFGAVVNGVLDANTIFWADILSEETILATMRESSQMEKSAPLPIKAAYYDHQSFARRIAEATMKVADQGISPQKFFSYVESLNIYCNIYTRLADGNFSLTVQNGFSLNEDSSKELFENCLDKEQNPYLDLLIKKIIPELKQHEPKVVFLAGRPGYFSMSLARLLKKEPFNPVIVISRHASEYYSMNKIDHLLLQNTYLFQAIDAVILEYFSNTERAVVDAVLNSIPLSEINNLICRSEDGAIIHTGYQVNLSDEGMPAIEKRPRNSVCAFDVSPDQVVNVHLFPHIKCYWNRCAFCGINKKYHFENPVNAYCRIYDHLSYLKANVTRESYIWFIDEAFPPNVLSQIAQYIAAEMPGVKWQARCRIEPELLCSGLPEQLSKSGLRELRLGLESGSYRVLRKMNKFDEAFSFELLEELCRKYTDCGISIHFPVILGFPGEGPEDRRETYDLLRKLTDRYPLVSFNANLFGLDISSKVFRNWTDYDVLEICFPCAPSHYLGNILPWNNDTIDMRMISLQRDQIMRDLLYPWLPAHALTPPHIFYRLSETIRNTVVWKDRSLWTKSRKVVDMSAQVQCGDLTIMEGENSDVFYIYSWETHHYMLGNSNVIKLLTAFSAPRPISEGVIAFNESMANQYTENDLQPLLSRLISDRYLVIDA